jgi:hypothetical protein
MSPVALRFINPLWQGKTFFKVFFGHLAFGVGSAKRGEIVGRFCETPGVGASDTGVL